MADWIELRSAQLKSQEAALDEKLPGAVAVDLLEMAVRHDVDRWNELNPGYRRRIDGVRKLMPSGAFRVYKTSFPPVSVDAMLDPQSSSIILEASTVRPGGKGRQTDRCHFTLAAGHGGFHLATEPGEAISFADASRVVLEPIIEAIR
jgi:hypothetical protein